MNIYEKHTTADAYRFGPSYTPYAIVAVDKRFSDAELAAEAHSADADCAHAWVEGDWGFEMQDQYETILRFATHPHFDEDTK
jgi:hypothetical protein